MSRIFVSLSLLPLLLVVTTMGVGWWIGDYNGVNAQYIDQVRSDASTDREQLRQDLLAEPQRRFKIHFQLGIATSLTVVLINCLSVTYLIGTSRWVKEVCETYGLDAKFVEDTTRLKRTTFPWSVAGVFAILTTIAFGAASDPGTLRDTTSQWVTPHLISALVSLSIIVIAILLQATNLQRNAQIIEDVVAEVQRERESRGLPVEAAS